MPIVNGHGGRIVYYPTDASLAAPGLVIELGAWAGNWKCDYVPVTPSGSGNGRKYLPVIGDHTWQATFPLDANQDPSFFVTPLRVGDTLRQVFFRRGNETNSGLLVYDLLEHTTLTDVLMLNDNQDALRVQLVGMGGELTQGQLEAI